MTPEETYDDHELTNEEFKALVNYENSAEEWVAEAPARHTQLEARFAFQERLKAEAPDLYDAVMAVVDAVYDAQATPTSRGHA